MTKKISLFAIIVCILLISGCTKNEANTKSGSITILWAEWAPADYLQELTKDFTSETGIEVNIVQEPWDTFQIVFFEEMEAKGESYDMVVGDSQWLGKGSVEGHYIELTTWMDEKNVAETMTPASITGYSEYPKGSGHYWAIPLEGDANGFAYRKDLFEDPNEKANFEEKYGYELDVPETWDQLKDIAEFFYRPEEDFYGISLWTEKNYDGITMSFESLLWAWGADLGDHETYKVKGILNSEQGVEALKFFKELYQFTPPNWDNAFFMESNNAIAEGKVAISQNFFAFFPDLIDPGKNPHANVTGFFANPRGPENRVASLGGQGISIVSYSKKKDLSLEFLEWFIREDTQVKWGELGGYTCNENVLKSDKFIRSTPYNRALMESMGMIKDFWAVPEYGDLLEISQDQLNQAVTTDELTAEEAMDNIATEWEEVFEYAGYYKE